MVASVQAQIQTREREKRLSELTNKELSALQPDTVTYKSVGKMYVPLPPSLPPPPFQIFFLGNIKYFRNPFSKSLSHTFF